MARSLGSSYEKLDHRMTSFCFICGTQFNYIPTPTCHCQNFEVNWVSWGRVTNDQWGWRQESKKLLQLHIFDPSLWMIPIPNWIVG